MLKKTEWTGAFKSICPSVFDFLASGILFITFIDNTFYRGLAFVFYTFFLVSYSMMIKQRRKYLSIPLGLFVVWSLGMVFCHKSINIVPNAIMNYYFNVSIMFEGFIYILCGVLLLKTIIEYSKDMRFVYLILPIALYPLFKTFAYGGRITPVVAIAISCIIYLALKRQYLMASIYTILGMTVVALKWQWVMMKFACRPYINIELLRQMKEHPWVGSGFNHTLLPDNMVWVRQIGDVVYGWIYRHNDFLSLGAYMGIFALVCVAWFTIQSIRRIGISIYIIPFLAIVLTCLFQSTMFSPDKAAACIVLSAVSLKETYKGELS